MEHKDIPITKETVVDRDISPKLGPVTLSLPEGDALCHDAVSLTSIVAEYRDCSGRFLAVIAAADFGGRHLGSITHMTPDQARSFAASLIGSADEIDGGGRLN